jgi:hypothetical protein
MVSNINPLWPVELIPTTESVRLNFAAAKTEIEALQARDLQLLPLIGGTLTGPLLLPPVVSTSPNTWAATKLYVDQAVAAGGGGGGPPPDLSGYLELAGGTMTGSLLLEGDQSALMAAVTVGAIPGYVDDALGAAGAGDAITITPVPPLIGPTLADVLVQIVAQDALKVNKAGDTMTQPLLLPPTVVATPGLAAVTKDYVDATGGNGFWLRLDASNSPMTGYIIFDEGQPVDGGEF